MAGEKIRVGIIGANANYDSLVKTRFEEVPAI